MGSYRLFSQILFTQPNWHYLKIPKTVVSEKTKKNKIIPFFSSVRNLKLAQFLHAIGKFYNVLSLAKPMHSNVSTKISPSKVGCSPLNEQINIFRDDTKDNKHFL